MVKNPYSNDVQVENDMEDFKMPYQIYGQVELEVMIAKYKKLSNRGHGLIVRLRR